MILHVYGTDAIAFPCNDTRTIWAVGITYLKQALRQPNCKPTIIRMHLDIAEVLPVLKQFGDKFMNSEHIEHNNLIIDPELVPGLVRSKIEETLFFEDFGNKDLLENIPGFTQDLCVELTMNLELAFDLDLSDTFCTSQDTVETLSARVLEVLRSL